MTSSTAPIIAQRNASWFMSIVSRGDEPTEPERR
jgi:hypothetical protein